MSDQPPAPVTNRLKLCLLLALAAALIWAIYNHQFHLNDQRFMIWDWRHLNSTKTWGAAALLAIPFFLGQWLRIRRPSATAPALALVSLSAFTLMIAFLVIQWTPIRFDAIGYAAANPPNGGYLAEGAMLQNSGATVPEILRRYPQFMPRLLGHAYSKPPGWGLASMWLVAQLGLGPQTSQLAGLLIAAGAALAVPATYLLIRHLTRDRDAAFLGASFLALSPSLLLFYPTMDQLYPLATVILILLWSQAIAKNSPVFAALFGAALSVTLFFTYLPAALAFFLAGISLTSARPLPLKKIAILAATALATLATLYLLLWLATGFNPIATFLTAWRIDHQRIIQWSRDTGLPARRLPGTIPWDFYSCAMGLGWIGFLLVIFYLLSAMRGTESSPRLRISLLCIAQFLFVAFSGMISGETIRIWIFMLPLLMVPIGLELSRWRPRERIAVFAALLAFTTVLCQSMVFII
jgi:hypothetical protein